MERFYSIRFVNQSEADATVLYFSCTVLVQTAVLDGTTGTVLPEVPGEAL